MSPSRIGTLSLVIGGVATLAAAICCVGPKLAAVFGCRVRWLAHLFTALAPYNTIFVAVAAAAFAAAHYRLYGTPSLWTSGGRLKTPGLRRQRIALWLLAGLGIVALLTPLLFPPR